MGLILALTEVARYGQGGQRLRWVTIGVFRRVPKASLEVERMIVRRTLALVGSQNELRQEVLTPEQTKGSNEGDQPVL